MFLSVMAKCYIGLSPKILHFYRLYGVYGKDTGEELNLGIGNSILYYATNDESNFNWIL